VPARDLAPPSTLAGTDVVIVGYFSGKQKDFAALMDAAAEELTTRGAQVVGRIVQRRGVSGGGAKKMALPYSSRTLLSHGKTREAAALCERTHADAAVFLTSLTARQRHALTGILGCPVVSLADAQAAG
jgi:50S ribosomal subunit-associated GTPase HflX